MKKMFLILVLVASAITQTVSAADDKKVSPRLREAFAKEFSGAQSVNWQEFRGKDVFKASFILNHQRLIAFFDTDGTLLSTGRFVAESNLPILVSRAVSDKFSGYKVLEVMEYTREGDTQYAIVLENEKKTITANAYSSGSIVILEKKKKS